MKRKKVRIGTVFSGIGAPEQAASRVFKKVKNIFACEIDKFARQSYHAMYDVKHMYEDITTSSFKDHKIDILVGGSPCQSFSTAGKRMGFEDTRGTLFYEFARALKESKPKYFIFENVKGMVNHDKGRTIETVLRTFGELNYDITARVLNTKEHGVPQNRERIFIVGVKRKKHKRKPLAKIKGASLKIKLHNKIVDLYEDGALGYWHEYEFPEPITLEKKLKDVLEEAVDEKYYLSDTFIAGMEVHKERHQDRGNGFAFTPKEVDDIESVGCLTCKYGNYSTDTYIKELQEGVVGMLDIKGNESIRMVYGTDGVSPCLTTMGVGNREPKIQVPSATKQWYETASIGDSINLTHPKSKTGRGRVEDYRIRKLTPLECWRLQDFPDEAFYKAQGAGLSDSQLYKQAGNSMSVNVIELIMKGFLKDEI